MIQKIKKMDWTWFAVNLRIKWDLSHLNVVHAFLFSANLNFVNFSEVSGHGFDDFWDILRIWKPLNFTPTVQFSRSLRYFPDIAFQN